MMEWNKRISHFNLYDLITMHKTVVNRETDLSQFGWREQSALSRCNAMKTTISQGKWVIQPIFF